MLSVSLRAQCGCPGEAGASVGGITPIGGTTNIGIIPEKALRIMLYYRYGTADQYYERDSKSIQGSIKSFNTQYLGMMLGWGFNKEFAMEAELGYFIDKTQEVYIINTTTKKESSKGLSHLTLYGKYNLISTYEKDFEWTVGLGAKAPLSQSDSILPQHVQASTGAFGGIALSYLHKSSNIKNLDFFLINRFEINALNSLKYRYGNTLYTSLFASYRITDNLQGILELRNDYRAKDNYSRDSINNISGGTTFTIAPQLNYHTGNFNISAMFDFPFYKYYNGSQLSQKYALMISLSYLIETKDRSLTNY
jgi:hypothetical protein